MPYDFPFRQKHVDTLRELISKQQAKIEKHWPQNGERDKVLNEFLTYAKSGPSVREDKGHPV